MLFSLALLLPALAAAAPVANVESRDISPFFTLMSVRSASPIHFSTVNASDHAFWIGKPTSTYCQPNLPPLNCSQLNSNATVLGVGDVGKPSGAFFDEIVPGGQRIYVQKNGALGYTVAHSGAIPEGSYTDGFVYTAPQAPQSWGYFNFTGAGASGLFACPTTSKGFPYQIYADVPGMKNKQKCLGFDAFALAYDGPRAWQYQ